ncbi:MAG: pyruvate kinase [Planctomycetes bacterium RBG_16_64_10]|nr:MAG: pyruvate kinase [Planctomycetes bacterium RBG_16_64_10]
MSLRPHKTKIVATIGPACDAPAVLEQMIRAGMSVARLNFSHGTFDEHAARIERLQAAAKAVGREIGLMADLPGPKMRIGQLAEEPIQIAPGATFTLTTQDIVGDAGRASVTFARLPQVVKPGDRLFLNDGIIHLEVERVDGPEVHCRALTGGELRSRKGLNLPGIDLGISAFTERDRAALTFALAHGVDAVSQSFVESAADIQAVREAAGSLGGNPFILAKIERARAVDRVDEILAAADGIMVARGDLGVEVPIEQIAILQKALVRKAVRLGKPVIIATQMLESMTHSRQPTRAEATDVANAVLDGADCVMLSGESATGDFPVEAVATLARITAATEPHRIRADLWERLKTLPREAEYSTADLLSLSVEAVIAASSPAVVVVPTRSGATARAIARFRLPVWIVAPTDGGNVARHLQFTVGIEPVPMRRLPAEWTAFTRDWVQAEELPGAVALLVQGPSPGNPHVNHRMEILRLH